MIRHKNIINVNGSSFRVVSVIITFLWIASVWITPCYSQVMKGIGKYVLKPYPDKDPGVILIIREFMGLTRHAQTPKKSPRGTSTLGTFS